MNQEKARSLGLHAPCRPARRRPGSAAVGAGRAHVSAADRRSRSLHGSVATTTSSATVCWSRCAAASSTASASRWRRTITTTGSRSCLRRSATSSRCLSSCRAIIPLTDEDRAAILRDAKKRRAFVPIAVSENLSWHQLASIEVNAPDLPGVSIEVGQRRRYTQGAQLLAHHRLCRRAGREAT